MSDSIRPLVAPGVSVRATDHPDLFEVALEGRSSASLPRPVLGILMLFDGERTYREIDELVRGWGAALPRADFVQHLARQLSAAGMVRLSGRELHRTEDHPFACQMCGNSCRGPEIGPLPSGRADALEDQFATLVEEGVQPPSPPPVRRDEQGRAYLARENGKCVFLGDDELCRIHGRFGLYAKPVACWLFPVVAVVADGEVRIGISGSCMRHHETFDGEETLDVAGVFAEAERVGVRPMAREYKRKQGPRRGPKRARRRNRPNIELEEDALLEWLAEGAVDPGALIHACGTGAYDDAGGAALSDAAAIELARIVKRWADDTLALAPDALPRAVPANSRRARHMRRLATTLAAADLPADTLREVPERWQRYLAYRLRNHLFLRAGYGQGDLRDSILVFLVGAAAAVWDGCLGADERTPEMRFGEAMVVWSLATDAHQSATRILGTTDREAMLRRWLV